MQKVFGLVKRGDLYLLRRLVYPHYKALVDLNRCFPEIKEIVFLDKCCVSEMADAINQGGIFLESYAKESDDFVPEKPQLDFFGIAFVLTFQIVSSIKLFTLISLKKLTEGRKGSSIS